ncbi:MAG: DUF6528 family protein [Gemmatimonadota bacterium]|nr:DUF6528 family protein [Gemmatimonadota bacterium]
MKLLFGTILIVAAVVAGGADPAVPPAPGTDEKTSGHNQTVAQELILCGWDEVFILRIGPGQGAHPEKTWTWKAMDRPELPDSIKPKFATTDECKPLEEGAKVLITSSGNGVALVERSSGEVLFWATAPNAHSADILPGGRVAVAASHSSKGRGDRLIVFAPGCPGTELCSMELSWGHGVVWDEKRNILWALSDSEVRAYELVDWETEKPSLKKTAAYEIPERGGHDLYPVPGTSLLGVSSSRHSWLFDRDQCTFKLHPRLADNRRVKSMAVHPASGRLAWIKAGEEHWWAERVHFLNPEHTLHLPGEHLYKARWIDTEECR